MASFSGISDSDIPSLPKGWALAEVTFRSRSGGNSHVRWEIIELSTGDRYWNEPLFDIAFKCFCIFTATPFYLLGYVTLHALRAPLVAISVVKNAFSRPDASCRDIAINLFWVAPGSFIKEIWAIVRSPLYALGIELGALYGILFPLSGRKIIASAERSWHQKDRYQHLLWHTESSKDFETVRKALTGGALTDRNYKKTLFLAFCMQPYGNLNGVDERGEKDVLKVEYFTQHQDAKQPSHQYA